VCVCVFGWPQRTPQPTHTHNTHRVRLEFESAGAGTEDDTSGPVKCCGVPASPLIIHNCP
jgi:hypothetical protein